MCAAWKSLRTPAAALLRLEKSSRLAEIESAVTRQHSRPPGQSASSFQNRDFQERSRGLIRCSTSFRSRTSIL